MVDINYDADIVTLQELLEIFFIIHDPTTLNRQGADVGTQYRSAIFYHNERQKQVSESVKEDLDKAFCELGKWLNSK